LTDILETEINHKFLEIKLRVCEEEENKGIFYILENRVVGKYLNKTKGSVQGYIMLPINCPVNLLRNRI
jgi:hypothetical protein